MLQRGEPELVILYKGFFVFPEPAIFVVKANDAGIGFRAFP